MARHGVPAAQRSAAISAGVEGHGASSGQIIAILTRRRMKVSRGFRFNPETVSEAPCGSDSRRGCAPIVIRNDCGAASRSPRLSKERQVGVHGSLVDCHAPWAFVAVRFYGADGALRPTALGSGIYRFRYLQFPAASFNWHVRLHEGIREVPSGSWL